MIKALSKMLFITFFLFNFTKINPLYASLEEELDKKTVPFHFKLGAGDPKVANDNGTEANLFMFNIPCVVSPDTSKWFHLGFDTTRTVKHYMGALPSLSLNPTTNIFLEHLQLAFLPQIKKGGRLSQEETIFSKTFNTLMQKDPTSHVGCHFYMPEEIAEGAGIVLLLPGSNGARFSDIDRALAYARQGIPCLIPDFVSTAKTNKTLRRNSTIQNQLAVSFFGNALSILSLHHVLQGWDAIDPTKIVWDCESIGATQALLALSPEVIAKFEEDFIPPAFIALNDFAPVLITSALKESPFWTIPKTIWGGTADEFTPLSQVEEFLDRGPEIQATTLIKHDGYHDARSLDEDTLHQEGGTYELKDATNYTGLCAYMTPSVDEVRKTVEGLDIGADAGEIMGALEIPFNNSRLHLELEDVDLAPQEVARRVTQLPKGAIFGPTSKEKATELRNEVIAAVLKYAKPSLEDEIDF